MKPEAVFFDLDGTLADTAPDLGGALNRVRQEEGLPALPLADLRPFVSQGVRGLVRAGFGLQPEDAAYSDLHQRVLAHYAAAVCVESRLFDGMDALLCTLEQAGIPWGIITNKHARFTLPVVAGLGLSQRACCVVSGDTTAAPKPAPDSLLHACALTGVSATQCWYVGDDLRDIQAAQAAGMRSIAAAYGYLGTGEPPAAWQANALVDSPSAILPIVFAALVA